MIWVDCCIKCSVQVNLKASFWFSSKYWKNEYFYYQSLSVNFSGKSTFTINITIGKTFSFGHPWVSYYVPTRLICYIYISKHYKR